MWTEKVYSLVDLPQVASDLLLLFNQRNQKIIGFKGQPGAGKTTLIQALGEKAGVVQNINSPTFSLIHEYTARNCKIYHFDFYRLEKAEECLAIGFLDYMDSGEFCWIEWFEVAQIFLPDDFLTVEIQHYGEHQRKLLVYPTK